MTFLGGRNSDPYLLAHKISAGIIDLVDSSSKHCYFVSPWVRLWRQLERSLEKSVARGVRLTFVLRNEEKSIATGRGLNSSYGAEVVLIDRLHTKLYLGDRMAIIGSMNLYDVSAERNLELAVLVQSVQEIRRIRRDIVLGDLLALKPAHRIPGSFDEAASRELDRYKTLSAEVASRGHCVVCDERIELDLSPSPQLVRCKTCWAREREADPGWFKIKYCHYCGEPHSDVLAKPLHLSCRDRIEEYRNLRG